METETRYYLDPDFRTGNRIGVVELLKEPRCIRCQKKFKEGNKKHPVTVYWNDHRFVEGHNPDAFPEMKDRNIELGYMGSDCFKKMTKEIAT